jgi:hypothetical protein
MDQIVQVVGALLVLVAFGALQLGYTRAHSRSYLVLNLVGAATLATLAVHEGQWGFFLLEGVWTVVSAWSLMRVLQGRPPTPAA